MNNDQLRLSATSYLVLGLIGLRGPSTPYDLKRAAGRSISYFWPFPHSQLYGEPARLAEAGLLNEEREDGGRRRVVYSLTDKGRETLSDWAKHPRGEAFEMRDMAVLQLFFSEFISEDELVALARDQVGVYQRRLEVYNEIEQHNNDKGRERRMAPLQLGVRMARVLVKFWEEVAQDPPPAPPTARAKRR